MSRKQVMTELIAKSKVSEGGRVVIPAKLREALGIKIGESVTLRVEGNTLELSTQKEALRRIRELVRKHVPPDVSLVDEFIEERREEARNE